MLGHLIRTTRPSRPGPLPSGPRLWTEEHVAQWLATLSPKLGELGPTFIENGINGPTLLVLDDETLNALVSSGMLRKLLKNAIEKLKNPAATEQSNANPEAVIYNVKLPNEETVANLVNAGDNLTQQSTVRMLKTAIIGKAIWNWDATKAQILYQGVALELNSTLAQANMPRRGTITVEITKELPQDNPLVIISYGVDLISQEQGRHAQMPCGHTIGCQSLTQYVRSLTQVRRQTQVTCPGFVGDSTDRMCDTVWEWELCRAVGQFTLDECKEFETRFGRNMLEVAYGETRECPGCHAAISKAPGVVTNRISCPRCVKRARRTGGSAQDFCWICLRPWRGSGDRCGNDCNPIRQLNETLASCGTKTIDFSTPIENVPEIRACPKCKTLIFHVKACKHMKCPGCKTEFCFSCLKLKVDGRWNRECGSYSTVCEVADRQVFEEPA